MMRTDTIDKSDFKWDSEDQRKGYLAFLYWARHKNVRPDSDSFILFSIQKDHESHEYWRELVGTQIGELNRVIKSQMDMIDKLTQQVEILSERLIKS